MNGASFPHSDEPRGVAAALALFDVFALALPAEMRAEYGAAMRDDLRAGLRERGIAHAMSVYCDVVGVGMTERCATVARDLRYAIRRLARAPLFSLIIIATIAVAIGINGTIYGLIADVYYRHVPVRDPGTLTFLWESGPQSAEMAFTQPDFDAYRASQRTLTSLAAMTRVNGTLIGAGTPLSLRGAAVNGEFFATYGLAPQLGRWIVRADEADSAEMPIVLSDELWRERFHADPGVIGSHINVSDRAAIVVGIAPPRYTILEAWRGGLARYDYYSALRGSVFRDRGRVVEVVGRFAPDEERAAIDADGSRIFAELARRAPDMYAGLRLSANDVHEQLYGGMRGSLLMVGVTALAVLIVACANVANLLLSRAAARESEIAVRSALGARRSRILRQLLTESSLLVVIGGALGFALAAVAIRAFADVMTEFGAVPLFEEVGVDARTLGVTAAAVVVSAVLGGLAPAIALSRTNVTIALKGGGRGGDRARGRFLRRTLVSVEIAVAVAVVAAPTMSVRGYQATVALPLGYDPRNVWVASLRGIADERYPTARQASRFLDAVRSRVAAIPGVETAGWSIATPFLSTPDTSYRIGRRSYPPGSQPEVQFQIASPEYPSVMRIQLLAGRRFNAHDTLSAPPVAIVNERFAREQFGSVRAALGQRVQLGFATYGLGTSYRTIIGVEENIRPRYSFGRSPLVTMPIAQQPVLSYASLVLRARPGTDLPALLRGAFAAEDSRLPPQVVEPLQHVIDEAVLDQRLIGTMLATFALVALGLALAGIAGVVAYDVSRRTNEIGVRRTFGATPVRIARMILGETLRLAAVGVAAGVVLSAVAVSLTERVVSHVSAFDLPIYAVVLLSVATAIVGGSLIPAVRAARIEPAAALRYE